MPPNIPLQSGAPTLVPNFYPTTAVTGAPNGTQVMQTQSPAAILAANPRVASTATITVAGTPTQNDVITVTITLGTLPGGVHAVTYTVGATPSATTIAVGIAAAINNDATFQAAGISATNVAGVVTVSQGSAIGNGATMTAAAVPANETFTISGALSGGSGCVIPTQNYVYQRKSVMATLYYGVPVVLDYATLVFLISQGAPIA